VHRAPDIPHALSFGRSGWQNSGVLRRENEWPRIQLFDILNQIAVGARTPPILRATNSSGFLWSIP